MNAVRRGYVTSCRRVVRRISNPVGGSTATSESLSAVPGVMQMSSAVWPPSPSCFKNYESPFSSHSSKLCFSTTATPVSQEQIDKMVKHNKVVVFMKGVPDEPRCGFSNAVVKILEMHGVDNYDAHDVLANESVRQGIKDYTQWQTIPQVFINGEFVGGCDIMLEMHKSGELVEQLQKAGIKSALLTLEEQKGKTQSDTNKEKK